MLPLLLSAGLLVSPAIPDDPPARTLVVPTQGGSADRVVLRSGGIVEGRIVAESDVSVAVEIANGARIDIGAGEVVSIARGTRPAEGAAPASQPALASGEGRTWWGLVRDAEGSLLGTRQVTLGLDPRDPTWLRIEETY